MNVQNPRVCPACRKPARNRPLPPEGFWQVNVLQRIGMYPYRCEACGARFYRKVPIGRGLGKGRFGTPPREPIPGRAPGVTAEPSKESLGAVLTPPPGRGAAAEKRPPFEQDEIPKIIAPPEATGNSLTHRDFVDLIDHISRSEQRKGLKPEKKDENN